MVEEKEGCFALTFLRNRFPHDAKHSAISGSRCCRVTHESRFTPGHTRAVSNWYSIFRVFVCGGRTRARSGTARWRCSN